MSKPYRLKKPIGPGYNMDPDDVRETKTVLSGTGHYKPPKFGITDIPDNQLIDAIRNYQKDNNLKVDGVMKPGGETENSIVAMGVPQTRCTFVFRVKGESPFECGAWHAGTYKYCEACMIREGIPRIPIGE